MNWKRRERKHWRCVRTWRTKAVEALEKEVTLPVLHIVDFTARENIGAGYWKVELLNTGAVMEEDFYKARLRSKYGLEVFVPSEGFNEKADNLIFNEFSNESIAEDVVAEWHSAYGALVSEHGVECMVLACTEFRLVFREQDFSVPNFETTTLHAKAVAERALREREFG